MAKPLPEKLNPAWQAGRFIVPIPKARIIETV